MIFNIMLFITASLYWYVTDHATPAIMGYILLLIFIERFSFFAILTAGATILAVVYYLWSDLSNDETLRYAIEIIYIIVLYIKAIKLFNNDELSLD
jgi:hypothetical protein